jgi:TetR/AcrR family transcriptional repressor of nem operon
MAGRPRNYDPAEVLAGAIRTFRRYGYAAASVDVLTKATGLRRGSLYAAFADKRSLFLTSIADYTRATVGHVERTLATADDPMAGIEAVLRRVARLAAEGEGRHGCLLTNTAAEMAGRDPEVREAVTAAFRRLEAAYETALRRAGAAGQLADGVDPVAQARLLVAVMHGIRVMGTSGAPESALQQIVDGALRGVRA